MKKFLIWMFVGIGGTVVTSYISGVDLHWWQFPLFTFMVYVGMETTK